MNSRKQLVIKAGKELCDSGLIARTWGNVSIRTGDNHFAITASGKEYYSLTEADVIDLNLYDLSYIGDVKPSGEKKVHQQIYKAKPDAGFVIHTHQSNASAVSAMGLTEIKLNKSYPGIGDTIPVASYGLPGTNALSKGVAEAVNNYDSKAILMSNHGAVCYGKDYDETFEIVRTLEEACGEYLDYYGIEPWIGPDAEYSIKWPEKSIGVYLDDFAQMFGTSLDIQNLDVVKIAERYGEDSDAVRMVIEKNCRAGLAAKITGADTIKKYESMLMRAVYKQKYSKLKNR